MRIRFAVWTSLVVIAACGGSADSSKKPPAVKPPAEPVITLQVPALVTDEDAPLTVELAIEVEGELDEPVSITATAKPGHGTLTVSGLTLTYTPEADFNGEDAFTLSATAGDVRSKAVVAKVNVTPVNDVPVPAARSLSTSEDTQLSGSLAATDADEGTVLVYRVSTAPQHGYVILNGTTGAFTYSPVTNFTGNDSFSYVAGDGKAESAAATITLTVNAVNDAPVSYPLWVTTPEDTGVAGALIAADIDSAVLTFLADTAALNGAASITAATGGFVYTPDLNYNGADAFTFHVSDGVLSSGTGTVYLAVTPVDDPPQAWPATITTAEDTVFNGSAGCSEYDGDLLTYYAVTQPAQGSVAVGATGTFAYAPATNATGADAFTFRCVDQTANQSFATVTVNVTPVNDAPYAAGTVRASATEDVPLSATLAGGDVDSGALTYSIFNSPVTGAVVVTNAATGAYTYTPAANYSGWVTFSFRVFDGALYSTVATEYIYLAPVNDAPVAQSAATSTVMNTPASGVLTATDIDGGTLTYSVDAPAANGTATIVNAATGAYDYTPAGGFYGVDTFTFRAFDGADYSAPATVSITVKRPPLLASLEPVTATAGVPVVLRGAYFYDAGEVYIGGVKAEVYSWSDAYIVVTAPASLARGAHAVVVTTEAGASAPIDFNVAPWLHARTPYFVARGATVSLRGAALGVASGQVQTAALPATVDAWSNDAIEFRVPDVAAGLQPVTAQTAAGVTTNTLSVRVRSNDEWVTDGTPAARQMFSAVWTGIELIVWGGHDYHTTTAFYYQSGGRYNPLTDSWVPVSLAGAPSARRQHSAVWTGAEMIVFGGFNGTTWLQDGGRYDPARDAWTPLTTSGAPDARLNHTAVWTGATMIVWGGSGAAGYLNSGGVFSPQLNSWSATDLGAAPTGRADHSAVWTGNTMIIFGGRNGVETTGTDSGGIYYSASNTWSALPASGTLRYYHSAVDTGREMIVWGGTGSGAYLDSGARYDYATGVWTPTAAGAPAARMIHTAVWTGREMIVWGGYVPGTYFNTGGRYDPRTDTWQPVATAGAPAARTYHRAIWTGVEMLTWGGTFETGNGGFRLDSGGRYRPLTNAWLPLGTSSAGPAGRILHSTVWTGSEMIIWGGTDGTVTFGNGARYNPATHAWQPVSSVGAPSARSQHTGVWIAPYMVLWGSSNSTGGRYNPATDAWLATALANAPTYRSTHAGAASPTKLLIWGGGSPGNDGGVYDPMADVWTATSALNAPANRDYHSAVWAGGKFIVWGGIGWAGGTVYLNTGGVYDPDTYLWSPMAVTGAPEGRYYHVALAANDEMIVWGGAGPSTTVFQSGGRYAPATDTWYATALTAAPSARYLAAGIWTGTRMVVWGGVNGNAFATGGVFDPVLDQWAALSTVDAPRKRAYHGMVWTGSEVIVWGGRYSEAARTRYLGHLGVYLP